MPDLGQKPKTKKAPLKKHPAIARSKFPSMKGLSKKSKTAVDIANEEPDDEVITPGEILEEPVVQQPKAAEPVKPVEPFADGMTYIALKSVSNVANTSSTETEFIKEFLSEVVVDEPIFGTIASQLSFMKNSGGQLL